MGMGMGVGRPSPYSVFGDKRALFLRVLSRAAVPEKPVRFGAELRVGEAQKVHGGARRRIVRGSPSSAVGPQCQLTVPILSTLTMNLGQGDNERS